MGKIINLNKKFSITLRPTFPYNFDGNFHKPSHFPSSDNVWETNIWKEDRHWITMLWKNKVLGLRFQNKGTVDKPKIQISIYSQNGLSKEFLKEIIPEIRYRFNFDSDISEFYKKFKNDRFLAPVIKKWKGMKPIAANSLYESLIIYLVLQNTIIKRSVQMLENLFRRFGKKVKFDNKTLSAFWRSKEMAKSTEKELRKLKVGYRAKFFLKISEQFVNKEIDEFNLRKASKEEIRKEMLKFYGIGPASIEYLLFEDFYHYDALETIPAWEQKIMSRLLFNKNLPSAEPCFLASLENKKLVPSDKTLNFFRKRYRGWEKLAFHYIWEDIFWKRKTQRIDWLEKEIRL